MRMSAGFCGAEGVEGGTFSGGSCTEALPTTSSAPNSPRVMTQREDLLASSPTSPGGQMSVSTSDRKTDVRGPSASCKRQSRSL